MDNEDKRHKIDLLGRRGKKKPYETPKVTSEKIYELNALKCGKCQTGPFHQAACIRYPKLS